MSAQITRMTKWQLVMLFCFTSTTNTLSKRPHIIVLMADDLGWNDVSFHGSDQILSPNIDSLAYHGVIIHQHYSQSLCSPSRAAFLTGKYPLHTGMQHKLILEPEPWGLPLQFKIMPEYLNDLGYVSHAIGKWHLGYHKKMYTPTHRGFASHYGFWNGHQDYYKHTVQASFTDYDGYDMRFNDSVSWDGLGRYSTDLFTERAVTIISHHNHSQPLFLYMAHAATHAGNYDDPLQAPQDHVARHGHISQANKRVYAGMVSKLDESVGEVIEALSAASMLNDSIIVLLSDNGAATKGLYVNHGSNWPLRGEKGTGWEGAVRTVGCVWSPQIVVKQKVYNQLMHISDWLPTLYSAAGGKYADLGLVDGIDQWATITTGVGRVRHELLHNIDDLTQTASIRVGRLKYINGTTLFRNLDAWTGRDESNYTIPSSMYVDQVLSSATSKLLTVYEKNSPLTLKSVEAIRESVKIKCKWAGNNSPDNAKCNLQSNPCVFDINKDPCEQENLYDNLKGTGVIEDFENRLKRQRRNAIKPQNKPHDQKANPSLHNNTWVSWQDCQGSGSLEKC